MVATIYARKSTEQNGVADEAKSVTRQIEHAKAYARQKGWAVDDAHVYVDDGISSAEFACRPGFLRLMNALAPRPPFGVLILSEVSRFGREAIETAWSLKQLSVAGGPTSRSSWRDSVRRRQRGVIWSPTWTHARTALRPRGARSSGGSGAREPRRLARAADRRRRVRAAGVPAIAHDAHHVHALRRARPPRHPVRGTHRACRGARRRRGN